MKYIYKLTIVIITLLISSVVNAQNEFITVWKTDHPGASTDEQIYFPGIGTNYTLVWEKLDAGGAVTNTGTVTVASSGGTDPYLLDFRTIGGTTANTGAGTYRIKVSPGSGFFIGFSVYGTYMITSRDPQKLLDVAQWGTIPWTTFNNAFRGASNMTVSATDAPDLSRLTSLFRMFASTASFNSDINHWDVSTITNFCGVFNGARAFNQPLNNWDVSNGTDFSTMFASSGFNQPIDSWDVSNGTDFERMFNDTRAFNQPLNNWNVSNGTDFEDMFNDARVFDQPLNNWDVSNGTNFERMFNGARAFNQPIGGWDVSNGTNFTSMFSKASSFNQPLNNWDVSSATGFSFMFHYAESFNQPLNNWDVSSGIQFAFMFNRATSFNQPLNNWDVSNAIGFYSMFDYAESFNHPLDNWNVSNVNTFRRMFRGARAFNQPLNNWDVSSGTDFSSMFELAIVFNQNLGSWNLSAATNLTNILSLSGLSINNYDNTLIGWANAVTTPTRALTMGAHNIKYCNAEVARAILTATKGWNINGDSKKCTPFITVWKTDYPGASNDEQIYFPGIGTNYTLVWEKLDTVGAVTNTGTVAVVSSSGTDPYLLDFRTIGGTTATTGAGKYRIKVNIGSGTFTGFSVYGSYTNTNRDSQKLLDVAQWGTIPWTTFNNAFRGASNMTMSATDAPNLASVTDLSYMFDGATLFNTSINHWNVSTVTNFALMLGSTSFNQPLNNWDVSNGTNFGGMFRGTPFNQPLNNWDVSNGTSFGGMFEDAASFNQNINNWDVSNGTNFGGMFKGVTNFNQPLDGWDVSKGTAFFSMFYDASSFNQPIGNWNVSKGINFDRMFLRAISFNQDIGSWDVSSGIHFSYMFIGASSFNQDIGNWNVSKGKDFFRMFQEATSFNQNIGNWNLSSAVSYGLVDMLFASGLSITNYDNTLIGWANATTTPNNLILGAQQLKYCQANTDRQNILINTKGWTINGDSKDCTGIICYKDAATGTPKDSYAGISTLTGGTTNWMMSRKNGQLVLESKRKGLSLTKMNDPATTIGTESKEGMIVWDVDDKCIKLYKDNKWECIQQSCSE